MKPRKKLCRGCLLVPPRRVMHAQYCTRCFARMGRPKRECSVCEREFSADVMTGTRCRECASRLLHARRIEDTYGITAEEYDELLAFQGGRCFICHRRPGRKRLAVDHDHGSEAVRGLLCKVCNRDVLGHLRDDVDAVRRIEEYLTNPPAARLWPGRQIRPDVTYKREGE